MSTTIAEAPRRELTIRERLKDPAMIAEIGKAMPKHCDPDRMARIALTAITRTPELANCTQASFFKCLLDLSQWGLEPDGRHAHLIPRKNKKAGTVECTLQIDYKGYVELVYRAGVVRKIHSDVVYEGDIFEWNIDHVERHVPWFLRRDEDKPAARGKMYAVYSQAWNDKGEPQAEVMSLDDVFAIRDRSDGYRAFKSGYTRSTPWESDFNEMSKKTAFRRLTKWLRLSAEIRDAFERDDDRFEPIAAPARQPAVSLSDITAQLIADGERYFRTDEESQEVAGSEPTVQVLDGNSKLASEGVDDTDHLQDGTDAAFLDKPPLNRMYIEGEFARCKNVASVDDVFLPLLADAGETDSKWLRELAEATRERLRAAKKKAT